MPKHSNMKGETGHYQLSGQNVKLIHSVTRKAVKKNWPMLAVYCVITVANFVSSYFTSGWLSVGVSFTVAIFTFLVGLRMVQQVITITNEVR